MSYRLVQNAIEWNEATAGVKPAALALLLVLAHFADHDGGIPADRACDQQQLGFMLGCEPRTIRRYLADLEEAEAIEIGPWGRHVVRAAAPAKRASGQTGSGRSGPLRADAAVRSGGGAPLSLHIEGKDLAAEGRSGAEDLVLLQPEPKPPRALEFRIADRVFDRRTPRPTVPHVAVAKMARRFLDAGWTAQQVFKALMETRAFTDNALQFQISTDPAKMPLRERTANANHQGTETRLLSADEKREVMRNAQGPR